MLLTNRFIRLFSAPTFDDEKNRRNAKLLNNILLVGLGLVMVAGIVNATISLRPFPQLLTTAGLFAWLSVHFYLFRKGLVRLVSLLLPPTTWAIISLLSLFSGGIQSPNLTGYIPLTLGVGLLFGFRYGVGFAVISALSLLAFTYLQMNGQLPRPIFVYRPINVWAIYILWLTLTGLLIRAGTRNLAVALRESRNYARLQASIARLQAVIAHLGQKALEITELDALFGYAMEVVINTLGVQSGELLELLPTGDQMLFKAGSGWKEDLVGKATIPAQSTDLGGYVLRQSSPVVSSNLKTEARYTLPSHLLSHQMASGMHVVVRLHDKPFGILSVYTTRLHEFTSDEIYFASNAANILATAIERRESERALLESEAKYRNILESIEEGYFEVDLSGNLTFFNDSLCRIVGLSRDELMGMNNRDYTTPETARRMYEVFNQVYRTGQPIRLSDYEIIRKDGQILVLGLSASLIRSPTGEPVGFRGIVRDVTKRKQAEEKLAYQAQMLRDAKDAMITADLDYRITTWNHAAEEMYGWTGEDVLGKKIDDIIPVKFDGLSREQVRKIIMELGSWQGETVHTTKAGLELPVDMSVTCIKDTRGRIIGTASVNRDITERKRAENERREAYEILQTTFENVLDVIIVTDMDLIITSCNSSVEKILGYPRKELVGESYHLIIGDEMSADPLALDSHDELFTVGHIENKEFVFKRKDGTEFPALFSASLLRDSQEKPIGIVGSFKDITQIKQVQAALRESEEKFRMLSEKSPNMIFISQQGKVIYANKRCEEVMGYSREEFYSPGFDFFTLIAPESAELVREQYSRHLLGQDVSPYEYTLVTKTGRRIEGFHTTKLINLEGEVAILGIITDITEQKQALEALKESVELYRTLVETSPDGVSMTDLEGRLIFVSRRTLELHGYESPDDVLGRSSLEMIAPEYHETALRNLERTLTEGSVRGVEYVLMRKDGARFLGELNASLIKDVEGNPKAFIATTRDITKRKQAEEDLIESERQLRAFHENAVEGIYRSSPEGILLYANPALAYMLGYDSVAELLEVNIREIYFDQKEQEEIFNRFAEDDEVTNFETRLRKKDGVPVWAIVTATTVRDAKDNILWFEGFITDITQRKEAEEELRRLAEDLARNEERFRSLVQNSTDVITIVDEKGLILYESPSIEPILGYKPDELVGCNVVEFVHPEDMTQVMEAFREMIPTTGATDKAETRFRHADGHYIYLESVVQNLLHNPVIRGLVVNSRDVTERREMEDALRESERMLREIHENAAEGIFRTTLEGKVLYANQAIARMFGYDSVEEFLKINVTDLYVEPDNRLLTLASYDEEDHIQNLELRLRRKDGSTLWVQENAMVVRDEEGNVKWYEGFLSNITDRKLAEMALHESEEQLRQAQKMEAIGLLAGGIAHDINNVLAQISTSAELIGAGIKDKSLSRYLDILHGSVERGKSVTERILSFARKEEPHYDALSIQSLLGDIIHVLRHTFPKDITVKMRKYREKDPVWGDRAQLHQVFMNLCLNAADAMSQGGVLTLRIYKPKVSEIRRHILQPAGGYLAVQVNDTGHGMDAETAEQVFDPFFSTKKPGRGTGLGLSIVYKIVKDHGGWIDLHSALGKGTTFTIGLPLSGDHRREDVPRRSESSVRGRGEHILIVEDEPSLRSLLEEILTSNNYRVSVAENGIEAWNFLQESTGEIDLIITDLGMPEMGGKELARKLYEMGLQVKIIVTSGYHGPGELTELKKYGIQEILDKPFKVEDVVSGVERILRG